MAFISRRGVPYTLFLLCLLSATAQAGETEREQKPITIGEIHTLDSAILGEERPYWVYLPASHEGGGSTKQRYPVLYLLDGSAHFHSASGVVQFMSAGINGNVQIPEMIVVAIPNTDRTRDLTPTHTRIGFDGKETDSLAKSGGGDSFLKFIREELFPRIDSTYRTLPYRILVGHSFGGLLAVHALLNAPEMFQAHIAIDPSLWWDNEKLLKSATSRLEEASGRGRSVYISLANNPDLGFGDPREMGLAGRKLAEALEASASPGVRSSLRYFEAEDHGSVPLLSLYHGLLFTFYDYKPSLATLIEEPAALNEHFERISERLGVTLLPNEGLVNNLGYVMLGLDKVEQAIEWFKLNVRDHPGSSNVYDSLGEAYMVHGDSSLAIEYYEKSLELNPANENAKQKLDVLRSRQGPTAVSPRP